MGILTKWAIRLQTSDFYGPSPPTTNPPPSMLAPPPPSESRLLLHHSFTCPPPMSYSVMENGQLGNLSHGKCPPPNIILLPSSPTKGDREIEGILARTGKAGKWNPPPSQYLQSNTGELRAY